MKIPLSFLSLACLISILSTSDTFGKDKFNFAAALPLVDGSTTLITPVAVIANEEIPFTSATDQTALCKAFGYSKAAVDWLNVSGVLKEKTVTVDSDGKQSPGGPFQTMDFLTCRSDKIVAPSKLAKRIEEFKPNEFQIDAPEFELHGRVANGKIVETFSYPLSGYSDATGVCNLYGYDTFTGKISVDAPATARGYDYAVSIDMFGTASLLNGHEEKVITSITCADASPTLTDLKEASKTQKSFYSALLDALSKGNLKRIKYFYLETDNAGAKYDYSVISFVQATKRLIAATDRTFGAGSSNELLKISKDVLASEAAVLQHRYDSLPDLKYSETHDLNLDARDGFNETVTDQSPGVYKYRIEFLDQRVDTNALITKFRMGAHEFSFLAAQLNQGANPDGDGHDSGFQHLYQLNNHIPDAFQKDTTGITADTRW